ncbi:hypothetical protein ASPACDRAFT_42810 [Aspergillus aculeatus ATCC 16872]|uniref:Uncharacterized protein n=1 Tax=Aspergillus aculeatus (strain ATCC 16872 / CBS 172.66 / WB 5094) TaxID=690307 RepID=A0A1L9WW29_ASPA1|nr:uncharacterized protein ASPACDRAFT_42810 [Aspergillus aculeatus ATCC 16872]OJK00226.1 hypothetical protein ASPACDRAFT_42810 [Aspergillus aculeatus ATCC 16872]
MESSLFFSDDPLVQQANQVVFDVMDGIEEPHLGAKRIDAIIRPYFLTPEEKRKRREPLEPFWEEVSSTAAATGYDSQGQDRLIQLMCNLSQLPPLKVTWYGARLWTSFPKFGRVMREDFPNALPEIDPDPTAKCCGRLHIPQDARCPVGDAKKPKNDAWIAVDLNRDSFMARVLGHQLRPWKQFAIWQLRSALEWPHVNPRLVDHHLAIVREWIFHAGYELYRQRYEGVLEPDEVRRTQPGPLYRGRADIPRERWIFWKERIAELAKFASDDFQKTAAALVDRMNKIEEDLHDTPLSQKTNLCY